ncbi:carnitine transporter [Puccinia graminis f. sp. tritici]|uniref:Carnitine transporter n=1 Tax=Puccinia graminis f. sp. tritici TaxID=56615 RepID=A0A5B0R8D1_PUCGR|nr:carnitine transporter [Puccinia graminis f. sp. tritici]
MRQHEFYPLSTRFGAACDGLGGRALELHPSPGLLSELRNLRNIDRIDTATPSTGGTKFSDKPPAPLPTDQQAALDKSPSQTIDGNQVAAKPTQAWKSFLSGGFGGICAVLVGQPFDLTKTRLQTAQPGQYSGTMDVVRRTFAKDGVSGFYRGMSSPLAGVTPMFAVSFWGYAMGKKLVYSFSPTRTSKELSYSEYAIAGGFSALPTTLIAAPIERIKVLLQVDGQSAGQQKYSGAIDCVRQVYKEGGIKSIFRGSLATVVRDAPGSAAYFVAYEAAKKSLTPAGSDPTKLNLSAICAAGGFAGIAMWSIAIPPDKTVKADGPKALFKGLGPAMWRAVPANAATFLGVELALSALNKLSLAPRKVFLLGWRYV